MTKKFKMIITEKENINFKILLVLLLGIISFISVSAKPEELATKYNIEMFGASIGEFTVTQTSENGNVNIEAITDVEVNFLFSFRVKYIQNTVYNQGVLQSSQVKTYKNDKLNSSTWLKFEKGSYLVITEKDSSGIHEMIEYFVSLIYFNEPIGIKKIYKERNAEIGFGLTNIFKVLRAEYVHQLGNTYIGSGFADKSGFRFRAEMSF
jgi:hypothetical protein